MQQLINHLNGDVFAKDIDVKLVKEYEERNSRKLADEKWLKQNKALIVSAMRRLGKEKTDLEGYRVSLTTPDESRFDMDKVRDFLLDRGMGDCLKLVVDEEALQQAVHDEVIDVEELKKYAWVEKKGSARLKVTKIATDD